MSFQKGNIPWNRGLPSELQSMYGKHHSKETKLKISKKLKGKLKTEKYKRNLSKIKTRLFKEGKITIWNKGLTKKTDDRIKKYGLNLQRRVIRICSNCGKRDELQRAYYKKRTSELCKKCWDEKQGEIQRKKIPITLDVMTPSKSYILGVLCGDGYLLKGGFALSTVDRDFVEFFVKQVEKWLKEKIKIGRRQRKPNKIVGRKVHKVKPVFFAIYSSKTVSQYLRKNYGSFKFNEWKVPKEITNSNDKNIIKMFLRGIIDSEGSVHNQIEDSRGWVAISSTNYNGLKQVQILLKKMGIKDSYITKAGFYKHQAYELKFFRGEYRKICLYEIGVTIRRKRKILYESVTTWKPVKTGKTISCENCGKEFYRNKSWLKQIKHHFCSKKCYYDSKRVLVSCTECGKKFYKPKCRLIFKSYFCNRQCYINQCNKKKIAISIGVKE